MTSTLIDARRNEFLKALVSARPSNRFKIVVVDKRSLRVLNGVVKLSEVLENDVIRIESIENGRKEDSSTEAVYFLTPSRQSIERLISDFGASVNSSSGGGSGHSGMRTQPKKQPTYRAAHVFFTSELPDNLFKLIRGADVRQYLKALKEMSIEYEVYDEHVFLTMLADRPLYRLYSPLIEKNCNDELDLISKKLVNVCGALHEDPVVRFFSPDPEVYGNTQARRLAFLFHTEMERVRQALGKGESGNEAELIIIDRSADPFAPVLHEFTYEAMAYDLLDIKDKKYRYTVQLASGAEEVKTVTLDSSDHVWQEYRFMHISDAQEHILRRFEELIGNNKAIVDMQAGERLNLSKMRDVVSNMPQFKEQLSQISAHVAIMQECMDRFNKRCLNDLAMIEQNLAMGTTPDGDKYQSGDIDVAQMLNNQALRPEDTLRLLLVYFIANPNLSETERLKLAQLAKLDRGARVGIQNMGTIIRWAHALDLVRQLSQCNQTQKGKTNRWEALVNRRAALNTSGETEPKPYDLSRYVPVAKHVLAAAIEGHLSEDIFPYVMPPEQPRDVPSMRSGSMRSTPGHTSERDSPASSSMWSSLIGSVAPQSTEHPPPSSSSNARQVRSLRSAKPTWQKRDSSTQLGAGNNGPISSRSTTPVGGVDTSTAVISSRSATPRAHGGPRLILFVIGGVTYSEIRAAEEIAAKYKREVIVGSTHTLTPQGFLDELGTLSFQLVDDSGRPLNMQPSCTTLGYGGQPDADPLDTYIVPNSSSSGKNSNSSKKSSPPERLPSKLPQHQAQTPNYGESQQRNVGRVSSPEQQSTPLSSSGSLRNAYHGYKQNVARSRSERGPPPSQSPRQEFVAPPAAVPDRSQNMEEMFKAKLAQSQKDWQAQQQMGSTNVNRSAISDMHRINLNSRGRSGSTGSDKKHHFLKRIL